MSYDDVSFDITRSRKILGKHQRSMRQQRPLPYEIIKAKIKGIGFAVTSKGHRRIFLS